MGSVVAIEAVDLPPADQSGSIANFITATMNEGNPLKLALMRLRLQFSLAKVSIKNFCPLKNTVSYILTLRSSLKIFRTGVYPICFSLKTTS